MKEFLAKGKRGIVYLDREKNVVVKKVNPKSLANNRLKIESDFLQVLNKKNIGPRFVSYKENELCMEFVDGQRIVDFFRSAGKKEIFLVIKKVFEQLHTMDKLGLNKQELTNPYKHIIIKKNLEPVMIDFERCRYTKKPKNVTQFVQFLYSANIQEVFKEKKIFLDNQAMLKLTEAYKKSLDLKPILERF